jgi:hypothetical protein
MNRAPDQVRVEQLTKEITTWMKSIDLGFRPEKILTADFDGCRDGPCGPAPGLTFGQSSIALAATANK